MRTTLSAPDGRRLSLWQGEDFDYLQVWGHYRTLVQLYARIHGRITDPLTNSVQ